MKQILYFLLLVLFWISCRNEKPAQQPDLLYGDLKIDTAQDTPRVQTVRAEIRPFNYRVQASGKIKAAYEETMTAQQSGVLQFCTARNGLKVQAGETIAIFETTALELRKQRLSVQKFNAQKEYESQLLGYEPLLKEKTAGEGELVKQKLMAATGLSTLEIDLKEVEQEIGKSAVTAPVDGVLTRVQIRKGMTVRAGQELFRIYSADRMLLAAKVLESDLPVLRLGQPAQVRTVADPLAVYQATLEEIDPLVDENGLITVALRIRHPENLLLGMNAHADIQVPQKKAIIIPRTAIVLRNNRPVVFTLEEGHARWNYVSTGTENSESIEITGGLDTGKEVIVSGNVNLAHNTPVVRGLQNTTQ